MKRTLFIWFGILFVTSGAFAQKFGYIDSEYILGKMPEYNEAQAEVAQLSKSWQEEIKKMYREIDDMHSELRAEEVLLTDEMKSDRKAAIESKEVEVRDYHNKVFGVEGLFFLKKKELIKPIQDRVFEAVEKVCKDQRLQIMFDKSGDLVMIYTDPIHDYTDYVLDELGLGDENDGIK
jgi:outer membrane protein